MEGERPGNNKAGEGERERRTVLGVVKSTSAASSSSMRSSKLLILPADFVACATPNFRPPTSQRKRADVGEDWPRRDAPSGDGA